MAPETHPPKLRPTSAGLKQVDPYWYPYTTWAKLRWYNRELLEVVSTEFRDRSMEYYKYALESGVTTVNGKVAGPKTIIKNGDLIENIVHRHEPPVTATPVRVLHHDVEREFIVVDKPGSIPVHGTGRYFKNTLIEILKDEFGFRTFPVNRLDRLTSGLMILPLSSECAKTIAREFEVNTVQKEYITRCKGEFPAGVTVCEEPLLTVDRQMGLNIVHPEGKPAKTVFERIRYDEKTDSTVVLCKPYTGRSHQIRVHLQFLGHPVANDPVYSETKIWGDGLGVGGIDTTPSDERAAPQPPPHLESEGLGNPESLAQTGPGEPAESSKPKLLPRETGEDIGMGSPVPLSQEAVNVITQLRNMKDEEEDWSRWRDVIFRVKGALLPKDLVIRGPASRRNRDQDTPTSKSKNASEDSGARTLDALASGEDVTLRPTIGSQPDSDPGRSASGPDALGGAEPISGLGLTADEAVERASQIEGAMDDVTAVLAESAYCPECYLPLHPDPKPEKLYIFLHALRYRTSLGEFATEMPNWAAEDWEWDRT